MTVALVLAVVLLLDDLLQLGFLLGCLALLVLGCCTKCPLRSLGGSSSGLTLAAFRELNADVVHVQADRERALVTVQKLRVASLKEVTTIKHVLNGADVAQQVVQVCVVLLV